MLLPCVHEPHRISFLNPSNDDSSCTEADSENGCIHPEQPPVLTPIYGTPQLDNRQASKPSSNEDFDILDDGIDLRWSFSCVEEYRFTHWCVKHNLNWASINERFRIPAIATVANFTSSHTVFQRLNEMSYAMSIDSRWSGKGCFNCLADRHNLRDNDYTRFFHRNHLESTEFLIQQPALSKLVSYAPAKEFNDPEECTNSVVKLSDWRRNDQVC